MIDFTLLPASPAQLPALAKVYAESRRAALPGQAALHLSDEAALARLEKLFAENQVQVAEGEKGLLGFVAFRGEWLNHLYVAPGAQANGVGTALLAVAMSAGAPVLRLWSFERNERARAFFESHEFRVILRTNGENNDEREPDLLLEWKR